MLTDKEVKIEKFFDKESQWQALYHELRLIIKETELEEDFKWMHPCYTLNHKNVALIHGFKDYCALLFHKGASIDDPENRLIQQTENVQAARQLRFSRLEDMIRAMIAQAIKVEKSGRKVEMKPHEVYELPAEMTAMFKQNPSLEEVFYRLTPSRQRTYIMFIAKAKRSETTTARLEKYAEQIFEGKGLNDH